MLVVLKNGERGRFSAPGKSQNPWCLARDMLCKRSRNCGSGGQHCLASMDPDLEAFSRNPTDGTFAVFAFQLAAFTKYPNEVFLSY